MKNLDEFLSTFQDNTFDGRFAHRVVQFVPADKLNLVGCSLKEDVDPAEWDKDVKPFTRENILAQLQEDVAFGFEKALNKRGLSAGLMFECVRSWNDILEEGLENWSDADYAQYGLPLFKATAVKYGWDNPIGDNSGTESEYEG